MKTRIISSVVFFPLLAILIFTGGNALRAGLFFVSLIAMTEVYKALFKEVVPINYISYIFLVIYYGLLNHIAQDFSMIFFFLFVANIA